MKTELQFEYEEALKHIDRLEATIERLESDIEYFKEEIQYLHSRLMKYDIDYAEY